MISDVIDVESYFNSWKVPSEWQVTARRDVTHWIGGAAVRSGAPIPVYEASTCTQLTNTFEAGTETVDRAVRSARAAFEGPWSRLRPIDRQTLLLKLADQLEATRDELGFLESADVGKPVEQARPVDIGGAIDVLRYFAGWTTKIDGRSAPFAAMGREFFGLTMKQPVGVVAAIAPWNFPLQTLIWKCAAAFAAGCTVVAKPSEITPVSTLRLAELVTAAGFPDGVFNVVNGTGAVTGAALVGHRGIDKVTFTGSTTTGRAVGRAAVDNLTHLTLELGGKSPALVCADADIDCAVEGLVNGIFFNSGQVCDATSRAIIDTSIYETVMEKLATATAALSMRPGLDPSAFMGPLVSGQHKAKVLGYVEQGRKSGLKMAIDRSSERNDGWFVGPVIFEDCPVDHSVWREEIFGPVLAVKRAADTAELLELASDTEFGLGAAIYSRDMSKVMALASRLKAGTIYINGHGFLDPSFPFGGLRQSGFGKDLGPEQIDAYLETKSILISGIGDGLGLRS